MRMLTALLPLLLIASVAQGTIWYLDADGDTWGDCSSFVDAPSQPVGYVAQCGDCYDQDPTVYPGAQEIPADGIDQDCDGMEICYQDADLDGWGGYTQIQSLDIDCADPGEATISQDCDDGDLSIHPGAPEIPNDGIDQDCDGSDLTDPVPTRSIPWSLLKAGYR